MLAPYCIQFVVVTGTGLFLVVVSFSLADWWDSAVTQQYHSLTLRSEVCLPCMYVLLCPPSHWLLVVTHLIPTICCCRACLRPVLLFSHVFHRVTSNVLMCHFIHFYINSRSRHTILSGPHFIYLFL